MQRYTLVDLAYDYGALEPNYSAEMLKSNDGPGGGGEPKRDPSGAIDETAAPSTLRPLRTMPRASQFIHDVREMVVPSRSGRHGPLPPLLLGLTLVTGLVDAFSYLLLGHVFVANMTGNVVFLGFALAGATGFSIPASLVALGSFVCGALVGGKLGSGLGQHRGHLLAAATSFQVLLLGASVVAAAVSGDPVEGAYQYALIVLLGLSMGIQNAVARKLAVPDLTTTVLTLTITGIAADSAIAGGTGSVAGRRVVAVTAMLVGALAGAALALHVHIVAPLAMALIVTAVVAFVSWRAGATDATWVHPS